MLLPLNAFLLRTSVTPAAALTDKPEYKASLFFWDGAEWHSVPDNERELLETAVAGDTIMALLSRPTNMPNWQRLIQREVDTLPFPNTLTSFGAVVFCAVKGIAESDAVRWVAWCFGSGSKALRRSSHDPRFGLHIALNMIASPGLPRTASTPAGRRSRGPQFRELRYRTTAPYFQQTGHRASRDIPVEGFRIDQTSDLVATVGGTTSSEEIATTVLGGRSIRFRRHIESISELRPLSDNLLDISLSKGYRDTFAWVDNITLVEDDVVLASLATTLLAGLESDPVPSTIDAILPDDLVDMGDDRSIAYILFPGERRTSANRLNLTIEKVADFVRRSADGHAALNSEIRFLDEGFRAIGTARLLECICADLRLGETQYITYDGDYYHVEKRFVERID